MNIQKIILESSVIALIKKYKFEKLSETYRHLNTEEITVLQKQGHICNNWDAILVDQSFLTERIFRCFFKGNCTLGIFSTENSGLYNSTIVESRIYDGVKIHNCNTVSRAIIEKNVIIENTNRISCSKESCFGNSTVMSLGIESGGREVTSFSELTVELASALTLNTKDSQLQKDFSKMIKSYKEASCFEYSIIAEGSSIRDTNSVTNCILLPFTLIEGAQCIDNCTILSTKEEETLIAGGASVYDSIIQWGCTVDTMALVSSSVLCEHSHVERHGKVNHSLLGPNSGIAEGEATSSLIGPFVGFHHQSMIIAALWPEGRGNIAYGVNCGSNHTGRLPDQEIHIGEGLFIGLGANIKYPANYTEAPYSIIATGITTLPQKISMPFSLIMEPTKIFDDQSPAYNEIRPAWLLSDNLYAIFRNEEKFKSRDMSKRMIIDFTVFRPEIINLITEARNTLLNPPHKREYYSDKDFPEIGKNIMLESERQKAVDTYTLFLHYYGLMGFLIEKKGNLLNPTLDKNYIAHRKEILQREMISDLNDKEKFQSLKFILNKIKELIISSRQRDFKRGSKIIDDYEAFHGTVESDEFIKKTEESINTVIALLN
jgi:hypothetical protein